MIQQDNEHKISDKKAIQTARKIIEEMPDWQKEYAKEIIKFAIERISSTSFPKMLN